MRSERQRESIWGHPQTGSHFTQFDAEGALGDTHGPQLFLGFHNPTDVFATCRRRLPNKPAHSKLSTTSELGSGTGTVFPNT